MTTKERKDLQEDIQVASNAIAEITQYQADLQSEFDDWSERRQEGEKGQIVQQILEVDLSSWEEDLSTLSGLLEQL